MIKIQITSWLEVNKNLVGFNPSQKCERVVDWGWLINDSQNASFRDYMVHLMDENVIQFKSVDFNKHKLQCYKNIATNIALVYSKNHSFPLLKCIINAALMSAPSVFARSGIVWAVGSMFRVLSGCSSLKLSPCSSQMLWRTQQVSAILLLSSSLQSFLFRRHLHRPFNLPKDISTTDRALLSL